MAGPPLAEVAFEDFAQAEIRRLEELRLCALEARTDADLHLGRRTMLSSGGMTRLVGRLEQRGLVRRDPDPDDARAFHASLTDAGRSSLAQARITHDNVIANLLGDHLTPSEAQTLTGTLAKVLKDDKIQRATLR